MMRLVFHLECDENQRGHFNRNNKENVKIIKKKQCLINAKGVLK